MLFLRLLMGVVGNVMALKRCCGAGLEMEQCFIPAHRTSFPLLLVPFGPAMQLQALSIDSSPY